MMKKLKILAKNYTLQEVDTLVQDHNAYGMVFDRLNVIKLQADQPDQCRYDTIIHESLHAIESQIKFFNENPDEEERKVILLTTAIISLVRDNKWLFKEMIERL